MKRMWIAITLLAVSVTLGIFGFRTVKKSVRVLNAEINAGYALSMKEEDTSAKDEAILQYWEKEEKVFSILLDHSEIEELENNILSLSRLAEAGDIQGYRRACIKSMNLLKGILENEGLKIQNIL